MQEENLYIRFVRKFLPSPFTIALILTAVTFLLAWILTERPENSVYAHPIVLLEYWETGFWELLTFTMQMALILILGHTLALTPIFNSITTKLSAYGDTSAKAASLVSLITILMSFINWGLCLVFGAIFARKIAETAQAKGWKLNYPLIGAAGYSGMMCWHGGLSGSAPLTVSGSEHFLIDQIGAIGIDQTILSGSNLITLIALMIIIPASFYVLGLKSSGTEINLPKQEDYIVHKREVSGAERLDHAKWLAIFVGIVILFLAIRKASYNSSGGSLSFINLNYINFTLFGLGILFHGSVARFMMAVQEGIKGSSGIIIQFPLYAGIMGIMNYSGLGALISQGFVDIATATTLPIYVLLSAGLVNIFVPSGGGQWVVQGPIVIEAAQTLGVSLPKTIMALSYGDQLTNMLQPFWALPLLGITKLKAKDILPYSGLVMLIGLAIFIISLLIF